MSELLILAGVIMFLVIASTRHAVERARLRAELRAMQVERDSYREGLREVERYVNDPGIRDMVRSVLGR